MGQYTEEPRHHTNIIPEGFDFGKVIEQALGDDPTAAYPWARPYHEGIQDWLTSAWSVKGRQVLVVKASPRNAFGEYADLLVSRGMLERDPAGGYAAKGGQVFDPTQLNRFPLPFASYHDTGHQRRPGGSQGYPIRNMRMVDSPASGTDTGRRGISYMRYPRPWDIPYKVDIWAKAEAHALWMVSRLEAKFWDVFAYHQIPHPHPTPRAMGEEFLMPIKLESVDNATDLERAATGDKIHRWSVSVTVEAWQFFDELMAPTVLSHGREYVDADGNPLADVVERFTDLAPTPLSQASPNTSAPGDGDH